jgi:hypothetical protein
MRRIGGACKALGKGAANQRRGIIEETGQGEPCVLPLRLRKFAGKKCACERARSFRQLRGRSDLCLERSWFTIP